MRCIENVTAVIIIAGFLCVGCSAGQQPVAPDIQASTITQTRDDSDWSWGQWIFHVNEDHNNVVAVPVRGADWHLNVTKFLEHAPCSNCLMIGKPIDQGDGTFKLKVILSHPFPTQPRYTGFDVKGIAVFPATRHWMSGANNSTDGIDNCYQPYPFYFSWTHDGGGGVLNADGYTFYFWPGYDLGEGYEAPVFKYQKGKYATEEFPDSTINPYLCFNDGSGRRMFKTTDTFQRTYHLKFPEGAFTFGYIVMAAWTPPDNLPVTNPELDFPDIANAETLNDVEFEQILTLDPDDPYIANLGIWAKVRYEEYPHLRVGSFGCSFVCPDIFYWDDDEWYGRIARNYSGEAPPEIEPGVFEWGIKSTLDESDPEHPYINGLYPVIVIIDHELDLGYPETQQTLIASSSFLLLDIDLQASGS